MKYIHYCSEPFKLDRSFKYDNNYIPMPKPVGLWVSVEGIEDDINWKEWCEEEEYDLEYLKCSYKVEFKETSNLIFIENTENMMEFILKWCKIPYFFKDLKKIFNENEELLKLQFELFRERNPNIEISFDKYFELSPSIYYPNWGNLSKEYDGIVIAPYQWDFRLNHLARWYYGWDCSSGCIWNLDCIQEFRLMKNDKD